MKKYQQLLLFIISVVSLSLLLIYRHEYNRLHYVLEVFNFFGQPCNFSDLQFTEHVLGHHDWGVEPSWQENENIYIYSAFWSKKQEAKVIVIHTEQSDVARNCYLWFEDKHKPIIGKFKYSKIESDALNGQFAYFYYCVFTSTELAPYAVSFSSTNKKSNKLKKILLTIVKPHKRSINTTICVSPTEFNKSYFVEFLSYHKLIGVDNFIFYGNSIPHRLSKIITNLSNRIGIKITFLAWNYPKTEGALIRTIIENDCLLRTMESSKNVITLELDEYIVPSQHYSLNDIISNYESKERLSLPVQRFCIKTTNRRKPIALQNTEVTYDNDTTVRYIYLNNQEDNVVATQAIPKGVASIHKYLMCQKKSVRVYNDNSILKFSTDLLRSTLVQLNLHDHI
ncbi:hypothetical protein ILUMI_12281 [Ignelater luminosus]|uniref:Glycosyltransferase family 92 protein n=1 Tax=Ignelater luminosus TaxID=2038154 RepID=A0A8K0CUE8_IGNLU|nr:hypothetical protein ILUMI_12281 [Ignelater luminosus]